MYDSLVDVFNQSVDSFPDKTSFVFLILTLVMKLLFSNSQLYSRVLSIVCELRHKTSPGDRVLLLFPNGIDFVCAIPACMYAGVVAVPAYPPHKTRLNKNLKRLERIIARDWLPSAICKDQHFSEIINNRITAMFQHPRHLILAAL